ncbi:MAG: hypothetical protein B6244_08350 [Candidatus Cloacimonetes bacterium 4572_55]|nr:MAG: hypothetical protein B6244_08350 [Candidatus Cloacimonetes bacterium 4572_55]
MIFVDENFCDLCGACVAVCPADTIQLRQYQLLIKSTCVDCQICVRICPIGCLEQREASE